jgi:uncharacterized protein (TIGR02687 family)
VDTSQIESALRKKFEEHRVVFWNDPDREFFDLIAAPPLFFLDGVKVLRLDQTGAFEAKLRIERDDPVGKYLVYAPSEEPEYSGDWLLDVRLYSDSFRADRASILLSELGLSQPSLRQHLQDRRKFFDAKERTRKLQPLVAANDTADDLDRKMVAVLARAEQPELFTIIRTIFHTYLEEGEGGTIDLAQPPSTWEQVVKFDLEEPFWAMVKAALGYAEVSPSLQNLAIRLLVTDLAHHLGGDLPAGLTNLVLPNANRANVVVCLGQWRDSSSKSASYDVISEAVARTVHLADQVGGKDIGRLSDVMTFLDVEKAIIRGLRDRVLSTADVINVVAIREVVTRRQSGHWANATGVGDKSVPRHALHVVYDGLIAAAEFFDLRNGHGAGFDHADAKAMYAAYAADLHRFDQLYRHFNEFADAADAQHWDLLKALRTEVEAVYVNWFLPKLALAWGKLVEPSPGIGLLAKWQIEGVRNQYNFYREMVEQPLKGGEYKRLFVIVSDALRYEAAAELARDLNGKYRFEADLSSMLSVLPSYTALGMASLLPHKVLGYKADGSVLVDGKLAQGFEQRHECLAAVGGMAIRADALMAMKKDEGREAVRAAKAVYVYHDTIDATGDKQASEKETFHAVRRALDEIAALVSHLINNLNAHLVLVTADHGFLFTESTASETDKSAIEHEPEGTVVSKRRYLLGTNLPEDSRVWHGTTAASARAEGGMEFWLPRGVSRFRFTGGSRYAHGGAMLQEVVVPVVSVRHIRGKAAEETKTKAVAVHILGSKHKVTTARHRFELIQMEPVSERVRPAKLRIAIYEGAEEVTNVETVTFDSLSGNMDERKKWVSLVLKDRQYDKKTPYRLVLRDADTGVEQQSADVTIDRAFSDDF